MSCGFVLAVSAIVLRIAGIQRTAALARAWGGRCDAMGPSLTPELVRHTVMRVARVAAFYPGRAECLEQSLTLLVLLRRRGIDAELRIGVERLPFTAHAWIEHAGRPINESAEFVGRLTPFPSLGG